MERLSVKEFADVAKRIRRSFGDRGFDDSTLLTRDDRDTDHGHDDIDQMPAPLRGAGSADVVAMIREDRGRRSHPIRSDGNPREVERMPVEVRAIEPLFSHAFELANLYRRWVPDSLYLALALSAGCQFMTADRKFYNATVAGYPETLVWVEDIPAA